MSLIVDPESKRSRPYPWKCPSCLKNEVIPARVPYTTEIKHDGILHSIHLHALETPQCRSCGTLLLDDHADEQINDALRSQLRLLSPTEIRANREQLELGRNELADRLGVAEATITRWETGALVQSRAVDNLMRIFFALPEARAVLAGNEQAPRLGMVSNSGRTEEVGI